MDQNIDFSGSDQIQTPQYPDVNPLSPEIRSSCSKQRVPKNSSEETVVSNPNHQEPPHDSDIHQLIEECCIKVCEEQKQNMENTVLKLVDICHQKQLLCMHDNVEDIIESDLDTKLLSINSKSQHPNETDLKSLMHENLLPIPIKCEVTLEDERECDVPISENSPVCDNQSDIFSDSKIDDDILVYDDDFEDIEYVEASLSDPEIISVDEENSVEEENVIQQEEEEVNFEDISQIQDIVLREKLLSITRLISNIESLNDNPTPDRVLNSFNSDNSLLDNFSSEFETFCDHSEETRSGNTTHVDNSLPEY
nr:hypothetical protein [Tanacetum cinerariifolium]